MNSLNSMEGVKEMEPHTVIMDSNGWQYKSFMVYEPGGKVSFKCDCGCNCFHKFTDEPDSYYCNSCDTKWS